MDDEELFALLTGIRKRPVRVGRISQFHAGLIGSNSTVVLLSAETVKKQESKHKDPTLALYLLAPLALSSSFVRVEEPRKLIFLHHGPKDANGKRKSYRYVVKATRNGQELYLVSMHQLKAGDVRAMFRRTLSIEDWQKGRKS